MTDSVLHAGLVSAGRERLSFFDLARSEATLRAAVAGVAGGP